MGAGSKISVVIPVYGSNEPVDGVIAEIQESLAPIPGLEIIIVWTPGKHRSADSYPLTREWDHTKVIIETRRGYGRAYLTGFEHATGDILVTLDGDGTYPAKRVSQLVSVLYHSKLGFLSTNRLKDHEAGAFTPIKRFGNFLLSLMLRILFGAKFKDSQSGMWVLRRDILDSLVLKENGMAFSSEIKIEAHRAGVRYGEVPIQYKRRRAGTTSLHWIRDGLRILKFFIQKRWRTTFT